VAGLQGGGGGSITLHSATALLSDCVFHDNSVTSTDSTAEGGGLRVLFLGGGISVAPTLTVSNSLFADNLASGSFHASGGGLSVVQEAGTAFVNLLDSELSSNQVFAHHGATGGGLAAEGPLQLLVEDHDFLANLATCGVDEDGCGASGGGVWIEHAVALGGTSTVRGSPLAFNSAPTCGWST
jgi:hypothetical protein